MCEGVRQNDGGVHYIHRPTKKIYSRNKLKDCWEMLPDNEASQQLNLFTVHYIHEPTKKIYSWNTLKDCWEMPPDNEASQLLYLFTGYW